MAGGKAAARRRWLKLNFPFFLDFVVATYLYLTLAVVGEWAIRRQYDDALARQALTPVPTPALHAARFASMRRAKQHLVEPSAYNAYAAGLEAVGFHGAAAVVGTFPDLLIAVVLSFFTLRALHLAALSDPGDIPDDYEAPAWANTPRRRGEDGGGLASPVDGAAVAVKCVGPGTLSPQPQRLSMPGTSGPTGLPGRAGRGGRHAFDPHYCGTCERDRPLRTHHCRYCNTCVVRFDHHCDWIDNCVGQRNHKCFLLFILYITLCIAHYLTMLCRWATSRAISFEASAGTVVNLVVICVYAIVVFPCAMLAVFFLCNTTYQLLRDETTIESNFPSKYPTRGLGGSAFLTRLRNVLGPVSLWWWPDIQPVVVQPGQAVANGPGSMAKAAADAAIPSRIGGASPTSVAAPAASGGNSAARLSPSTSMLHQRSHPV